MKKITKESPKEEKMDKKMGVKENKIESKEIVDQYGQPIKKINKITKF